MRNMDRFREQPQRTDLWEFDRFDEPRTVNKLGAEGKDRAFPGKPADDRDEPDVDLPPIDPHNPRDPGHEQPGNFPDDDRPQDERDRRPVVDPRHDDPDDDDVTPPPGERPL